MPKIKQLKCFFGCVLDGPLHRFPKWEYPHTEKFDQWKSVLDSATQERGNNYIYNSIRICHRHFEDYFKSPSRRLTGNAIPTLNLNMTSPSEAAEVSVEPAASVTMSEDMSSNMKQTIVEDISIHTETEPSTKDIAKQIDVQPSTSQTNPLLSKDVLKRKSRTTTPKSVATTMNKTGQGQKADDHDYHDDDDDDHHYHGDDDDEPLQQSMRVTSTSLTNDTTVEKNIGFIKMDSFKLKLKNVLHSSKFCGICLDSNESMNSIDEELEIIASERTHATRVRGLVDVVFKKANYSLASSNICNSCLEKLIQSYIFVETAKETSQIFGNYVNDLIIISNNIFNQLPESKTEIKNIVIELDSKSRDSLVVEDEPILDTDQNNEMLEEQNESTLIRNTVRCDNCSLRLPSNKTLEIHKMKCKGQKEHLKAHRESHYKVKCKFCHKLIVKSELLDHYKMDHEESLLKCLKCELFYPLHTHQSHTEVCRQIKEDKQQCLMCLKTFTENELKSHICKYSCPECAEVPCMHYKYLKSYREQILNNADKTKCVDCDYVCISKEALLEHINRDHLNHHPYTCDKCGKQFYSKIVLGAHILRLHEDSFVCQFCDSEFRNINNYEIHVESCEDIKREFACENCPASFDFLDNLTNHMKRRHSTNIFPCGVCNKVFLKYSQRKEHVVKVHSELGMKIVECAVCQESFDNQDDLVQHLKSHGPDVTIYPCMICDTEYQTLKQFQAHSKIHKGPFATCHVCGKEMREILLKKHLTIHSNPIKTCETCGKSFRNKYLLKIHQKIHLESVPCPKCEKMINPARLPSHLRGHLMNEKGMKKYQPKYKCNLCEYKTWDNTHLESHMNQYHLKTKPYICHICSKDFAGRHYLRQHIKTHNVNSVACMVCLKSFANSTRLKMHLRLHTGEKPFTCEICGDQFRLRKILTMHKLRKHSDKTIICPLCSNKFHTNRDLRTHVMRVHCKQKNLRFDPRRVKGLDKKYYHLCQDTRRFKDTDEDAEF
ncbi:hypothetical protein PYW08_010526 [Mythimna loreyi]|uniref:Uncharacterized protein n=1 Tax=Mythimna loreyi TaxID=667449 RepID=A0ACC2Q9W3_9NEOP|nr:hypothetical protein PYW08_010526 [Mythimna loreyi]